MTILSRDMFLQLIATELDRETSDLEWDQSLVSQGFDSLNTGELLAIVEELVAKAGRSFPADGLYVPATLADLYRAYVLASLPDPEATLQ